MAEDPYSKREVDSIKEHMTGQINGLSVEMLSGFETVNKRLDYTNGKLRKVIIALVLVFGILIGAGSRYAPNILSLLI